MEEITCNTFQFWWILSCWDLVESETGCQLICRLPTL